MRASTYVGLFVAVCSVLLGFWIVITASITGDGEFVAGAFFGVVGCLAFIMVWGEMDDWLDHREAEKVRKRKELIDDVVKEVEARKTPA